jgi:hypothetical protein
MGNPSKVGSYIRGERLANATSLRHLLRHMVIWDLHSYSNWQDKRGIPIRPESLRFDQWREMDTAQIEQFQRYCHESGNLGYAPEPEMIYDLEGTLWDTEHKVKLSREKRPDDKRSAQARTEEIDRLEREAALLKERLLERESLWDGLPEETNSAQTPSDSREPADQRENDPRPPTNMLPSSISRDEPQPETQTIYINGTISRDFSGTNDQVASKILAALGERSERKADLSILCRKEAVVLPFRR